MIARRMALVAGLSLCLTGGGRAGDLNPPAGPIEATMKSLDAIEPRICLNDLPGSPTAMHVITQPGQYFLRADVSVAGGRFGIGIETPLPPLGRVSIDLNGFDIVGQPGSLDGVHRVGLAPASGEVAVFGGRILTCGGDGVHIENAERCTVDVSVDGCGGNGIYASNVKFGEVNPAQDQLKGGPRHRVANCAGHGVIFTQCETVSVADLVVSQCGGDGVHVVQADECSLSSLAITDCIGNGVSAQNVGTLRVNRSKPHVNIGTIGHVDNGRIANVGGHGVFVSACGEADIDAEVSQCGQDGVHVENTLECSVGGVFLDCGDSGIEGNQCARMAIGSKGMPTTKPKKGNKAHRVVRPGGSGVVVNGCAEVSIDDLECVDAAGHGVHCDSSGVANKSFVSAHSLAISRCGGDGLRVILGAGGGLVSPKGVDVDTVVGDGLHIVGASSVEVFDWRDDDCDGDGIRISAGAGSPPDVHVRDASSNRAGGNGATIVCKMGRIELARCTEATLDGFHIEAEYLEMNECTSRRNGRRGAWQIAKEKVIQDRCVANDNGWGGITVLPAPGSVQESAKLTGCSAHGNGFSLPGGSGSGFEFDGFSSVWMLECDASSNAGSGIVLADFDRDARLDSVTCSSNGAYGVLGGSFAGLPNGRVHASSVVCDGNAFDGMNLDSTTGGEISRCSFTNNGNTGLVVFGNGHVVQTNSCRGNPGGPLVVPVPGNSVGPLVNELTIGANCNPSANQVD